MLGGPEGLFTLLVTAISEPGMPLVSFKNEDGTLNKDALFLMFGQIIINLFLSTAIGS